MRLTLAPVCRPQQWKPLLTSGTARRSYAFQSGSLNFEVFNRRAKWLQKERAAANVEGGRQADYLKDEVAMRVCERLLVNTYPISLSSLAVCHMELTSSHPLQDVKRQFPRVLDLGANSCNIARALLRPDPDPESEPPVTDPIATKIAELVAAESSHSLLHRDHDHPSLSTTHVPDFKLTRHVLEHDELLPFEPDSFDMVLSSMSMHWINDLPGVLSQINSVLKPDCPFIGAMLGGDTLYELRTSLQLAEQERKGGISPHVSPLADVRDVGGLLQRTGFKMLTVDVEDLVVDYPDMFALMQDLQAMGEGNAVLGREMGPIGRDVLLAGDAIYRALHGNEDGSIPATFRIIHMIGWKESPHQAQPLRRGSGQASLKDLLEGQ